MNTKSIFFLTILSTFQGQAAEEFYQMTPEGKESLPTTGIVLSSSNDLDLPKDLHPWLQLVTSGENEEKKKGAPYTYKLDHHKQLPPHLLIKIIQKGYEALDAIAKGVIGAFPHELNFFAGDLEKYNERLFKQGVLMGFGTDYLLKTVYYSTKYTKVLEEFNNQRMAQLETFICVVWALTDYSFKSNQGFARGSFSIIDPESKLLNYLKNFSTFSARTPELPVSLPKDEGNVPQEVPCDNHDNKEPASDNLPPSALEHTDFKDFTPLEDTKDNNDVVKPTPPITNHESPLSSKEGINFSSDSDLDVKRPIKAVSKLGNLSPAIFNIMGSNFAYMRTNTSSHYVGLCDFQTGIDIRFTSSGFTLPLLPFQMTHVLWGSVQTQLGHKKTFVKFEEDGLGDNRSIINHTLNFSSSTKGIDENPLVRREKAIPASIAAIAVQFLMLLHKKALCPTWLDEIIKKYISLDYPEGFFQESKNIDISYLYKLSKHILKNKLNPGNIRSLANYLQEEISSKYDIKTVKYRTGNEIVLHINDFIKH